MEFANKAGVTGSRSRLLGSGLLGSGLLKSGQPVRSSEQGRFGRFTVTADSLDDRVYSRLSRHRYSPGPDERGRDRSRSPHGTVSDISESRRGRKQSPRVETINLRDYFNEDVTGLNEEEWHDFTSNEKHWPVFVRKKGEADFHLFTCQREHFKTEGLASQSVHRYFAQKAMGTRPKLPKGVESKGKINEKERKNFLTATIGRFIDRNVIEDILEGRLDRIEIKKIITKFTLNIVVNKDQGVEQRGKYYHWVIHEGYEYQLGTNIDDSFQLYTELQKCIQLILDDDFSAAEVKLKHLRDVQGLNFTSLVSLADALEEGDTPYSTQSSSDSSSSLLQPAEDNW